MAVHRSREMMRGLADLRYGPTGKRVRALAGAHTLTDSRRAVIVWEPRRIVPSYAVPEEDVTADLEPATPTEADEHPVRIGADGPPVLDPRTPFAVHTCEGRPLSLVTDVIVLDGAAFRLADQDLPGYVVLDFQAFDEWLEEDDPIVGHPRDPFKRIDSRRGSSRVQIEISGVTVADTTSPRLLFETHMGPRYYLPRDDVRMDLLTPSETRTTCAYKGEASYFSIEMDGQERPDVAWTYTDPLSDARDVAGFVAFFDERVDVILDGVPQERPVTPWS